MQTKPTFAELRRAAGLTQVELGKLIAIEGNDTAYYQPRIYAYEAGRKRIPASVRKQIAAAFNVGLRAKGSKITVQEDDLIHENHREQPSAGLAR